MELRRTNLRIQMTAYVLTVDNVMKMLAIHMRFRYVHITNESKC